MNTNIEGIEEWGIIRAWQPGDDAVRYPDLVTQVHRYEDPDRFGFHRLVPDTTGTWNVQPFAANSYDEFPDSPTYREVGVSLHDTAGAATIWQTLKNDGYTEVEWSDLPEVLKNFVTYQQAPLEWHGRLDNRDSDVTSRITVWVRGELPQED